MSQTFFFYDLETSGFSPREARIMQFAGRRTDLELKPIGEPFNILIRLTNDVLPDPGAVLLTGITPQKTIEEGISEAEFLKIFYAQVAISDTIFVGFNSVRFDDEFIRYLNYRNFYDPYEWEWKNGRSRWDLLDVVRMMRALRPGKINWPVDKEGKAVNKLEILASANNLTHDNAHDALSDVTALIDLANLVRTNQPKLFEYLRTIMCDKKKVAELVQKQEPFIYCSGKYESRYEKTTAVGTLAMHPKRQAALVFDLREDPASLAELAEEQILNQWQPEGKVNRFFPIKTLMFNRCPAIAPISTLDEDSQKRLKLTPAIINKNYTSLLRVKKILTDKILAVLELMDVQQESFYASRPTNIDGQLYDGFFSDQDKPKIRQVSSLDGDGLKNLKIKFDDARLNGLLPLYKARNYPKSLSPDETKQWEVFRSRHLLDGKQSSRISRYFKQISELLKDPKLANNQRYLLDVLELYGQSLIPSNNDT